MEIKAGTVIQGKIGFQAYIADIESAMVYGYGAMEWRFKPVDTVTDGSNGLQAWIAIAASISALCLSS